MQNQLEKLARLIRYYILTSTTEAGSGHPSSSLSATDLMTALFFNGFFRADLDNHENPNNDRLIFSKGHASPLFYALYAVAGQSGTGDTSAAEVSPVYRALNPAELLTLRKFGSRLEGHPTLEFPYTEVPTGSLGQGLSVGVGMAMNAKADKLDYKTFVLLGDSEMAEGSVWEAMGIASYYKLNNLVAILDVNRLGQRGETALGHNVEVYQKRAQSFGWETVVIDGHDFGQIESAYRQVGKSENQPLMIIAKTLKGKGVSILEDKDGKHGVALKKEELEAALKELGEADKDIVGKIEKPEESENRRIGESEIGRMQFTDYPIDKSVATRKAYGNALANLVKTNPNMVVLDAETSNSTYSEFVKKNHPEKFVECFIAEQNMVGMALGFSRRGKIPFVSTFAAFLSRAFDQIRMSALAQANIKFCGSHAGISIGEDGSSQMGLEEIAMFRALPETVVLYPSDAVSTEKLVFEAANHKGNVYIQTTRKETPILYNNDDNNYNFKIGGSCVLRSSDSDRATVVGAGITLHEALAAYEELKKEGINIRVVDLYSIKPIDVETLKKAAKETKNIITVEDNHVEGGIAEAVAFTLLNTSSQDMGRGGREVDGLKFASLSVKKIPHSGKPEELLASEKIDKNAIIMKIKELI